MPPSTPYPDLVLDAETRTIRVGRRTVVLTRTETAVLSYLWKNQGQVLSKRQILDHVWGAGRVGDNTLEVHVSALRHKLDDDAHEVLRPYRGLGYRLLLPPATRA